ncbi:MAG: porin family protein [Bacteroidota bacterium]
MKKIFLLFLIAILIPAVYSQKRPWRVGVKGGVNYIHLENYGKEGFYSDFDAQPGWTLGVIAEYTKGDFFNYSVAPEIIVTQSYTLVDFIYWTDYPANIQTIDIPINIRAGLRLSKIFRPYLLGNIYVSYIYNTVGDFFEILDADNSLPHNTIHRLYYGVSAGMGFDLWKFEVEGRYRWNMNRINTDDYGNLRQMGLELSVGLLF